LPYAAFLPQDGLTTIAWLKHVKRAGVVNPHHYQQ
jgi:hypothetical protein